MADNTPDQLAEVVEALTLVRLTPTAGFADLPREIRERVCPFPCLPWGLTSPYGGNLANNSADLLVHVYMPSKRRRYVAPPHNLRSEQAVLLRST